MRAQARQGRLVVHGSCGARRCGGSSPQRLALGAVGARLAQGSGERLGSQAGGAAPWPWSRCPAPRPGSQSPRSASQCARSPSVPRLRCTGRPPRARSAACTGAQAGSIRAPHTSRPPSACAAAGGARPQTAATDCTALAGAQPVARPQVAASRAKRGRLAPGLSIAPAPQRDAARRARERTVRPRAPAPGAALHAGRAAGGSSWGAAPGS